jgi:hypothetical protein
MIFNSAIKFITKPARHAASHAAGGGDPVSPADIGAAETVHGHTLSDLEQSGAADGQVPVWDADAEEWVPADQTGNGGGEELSGEGDPNGILGEGYPVRVTGLDGFYFGAPMIDATLLPVANINDLPAWGPEGFELGVSGDGSLLFSEGGAWVYALAIKGLPVANINYILSQDDPMPDTPWNVVSWKDTDDAPHMPVFTSPDPVTAPPGTVYNQVSGSTLVSKWVCVAPGQWKRIRFIEDEP